MHPALFPFSQPKTSHQSSKLHPDPDCVVLCRCPMWRPFPSFFRNNWPCHRYSDAAARYHTLDSTCSSGVLTPQPPVLSLQSLLDFLHRTSATLPTSNSPKAMRTQSRLSKQDDCLSISHVGGHSRRIGMLFFCNISLFKKMMSLRERKRLHLKKKKALMRRRERTHLE